MPRPAAGAAAAGPRRSARRGLRTVRQTSAPTSLHPAADRRRNRKTGGNGAQLRARRAAVADDDGVEERRANVPRAEARAPPPQHVQSEAGAGSRLTLGMWADTDGLTARAWRFAASHWSRMESRTVAS